MPSEQGAPNKGATAVFRERRGTLREVEGLRVLARPFSQLIARNWTSFQWFGYTRVMALTRLQLRLLVALFDFAQADRPANVRALAQHLDVRLGVVATQLGVLDDLGLVQAARVRLSLEGLAIAALGRARLRARGRAISVAA